MKIGKLIIEFRRAGGPKLTEEVFDALTDPEGDARAVIAKMARSAAKDFIDSEGERILSDVTAELEKRKAAMLASIGSAGTDHAAEIAAHDEALLGYVLTPDQRSVADKAIVQARATIQRASEK